MKEQWKEIKGFPKYQISTLGNVKSLTVKKNGDLLVPQINHKGYYSVLLYKNGKPHSKKIHRLVAETFLPNPNNKPQVNHIDGNKLNNIISNLEWCTNSENQIHAYKNNLEVPAIKRKVNQYDLKGNYIKTFEYIRNASKELNIDESSIAKCCRNKRKSAGNYIWKYANDNN